MADLKISALTAATTPLAGTEVLPIVQGGVTTKVAVSDLTAGRAVSATQLTSTIAIGTAPLVVASTTNVANLNASSLNGATFAAPGVIGGGTASAISATTINKVIITSPATASTLTIADGKTLAINDNATLGTGGLTLGNSGGFTAAASKVLTANNSLTLAGTDATTHTFPTTSATIARTDAAQTFAGVQSISDITDATSTTAASLKTAGGLAVAKKAYFGDTVVAPTINIGGGGGVSGFTAGHYTPTITNGTNVASSTTHSISYNQACGLITVAGTIDIDVTASGAFALTLTLPIASNLSAGIWELGGSGATSDNMAIQIYSNTGNPAKASFYGTTTNTANQTISFIFSYLQQS
jgi:hypothetical protein